MKRIFYIVVFIPFVFIATATANRNTYDPSIYSDQMYNISNTVNPDDWALANPQYRELQSICQNIANEYPNLIIASKNCIEGANLVIQGSVCTFNCQNTYNRQTYGPIVDKGLRQIDLASKTLGY